MWPTDLQNDGEREEVEIWNSMLNHLQYNSEAQIERLSFKVAAHVCDAVRLRHERLTPSFEIDDDTTVW